MKVISPNTAATLAILVTSSAVPAGTALTAASFTVVDKDDNEVQAVKDATIKDAATGSIELAIDQATTVLPAPAAGDSPSVDNIRKVLMAKVSLTYGAVTDEFDYIFLVRGDALVVGVNSFVSTPEAEMIAFELTDIPAWNAATTDQKTQALIVARDELCQLTYRYDAYIWADQTRMIDAVNFFVSPLDYYNAAQLSTLPPKFYLALKRAQLVEADYLLGGDRLEERRQAGTLSVTTGESSQMFRPGMGPVKWPVCARAIQMLSRFLKLNTCVLARG